MPQPQTARDETTSPMRDHLVVVVVVVAVAVIVVVVVVVVVACRPQLAVA